MLITSIVIFIFKNLGNTCDNNHQSINRIYSPNTKNQHNSLHPPPLSASLPICKNTPLLIFKWSFFCVKLYYLES